MPTIETETTFADAEMIAEENGFTIDRVDKPIFEKCNGKNCYPTFKDAEATRAIRRLKGWSHLRIYQCPECKNYHLTSN